MHQFIEHITCNRLEVVDEDGVVRARLYTDNRDGLDAVRLEIQSPKGNRAVDLAADEYSVDLTMWHQGNTAAAVVLGETGRVEATLFDPADQAVVRRADNERGA